MKKSVFSLMLALTLGISLFSVQAHAKKCSNEVFEAVGMYPVGELKVAGVYAFGKGKKGPPQGWDYWLRSSTCEKGYIVARVRRSCVVQSMYSRMGCQIPGMRYWKW